MELYGVLSNGIMTTIICVNNTPNQVWQCRLLLESLREHNFKYPVHILIYLKEGEKDYEEWEQLKEYEVKLFKYSGNDPNLYKYSNLHRIISMREHTKRYPDLGPILYLDSDILLLRELNLEGLLEDDICYGSDIGSYSNYDYYFKSKLGVIRPELVEEYNRLDPVEEILLECGIWKGLMEKYNSQTAGVHYLLKSFNTDTWQRVYDNTLRIVEGLDQINQTYIMGDTYQERDERGFQKFCADILATHIEIWKKGETRISEELNFMWPGGEGDEYPWFHNAGINPQDRFPNGGKAFWKGQYVNTRIMPYYPSETGYIDSIHQDENTKKYCQWIYINKIVQLREKHYKIWQPS